MPRECEESYLVAEAGGGNGLGLSVLRHREQAFELEAESHATRMLLKPKSLGKMWCGSC